MENVLNLEGFWCPNPKIIRMGGLDFSQQVLQALY